MEHVEGLDKFWNSFRLLNGQEISSRQPKQTGLASGRTARALSTTTNSPSLIFREASNTRPFPGRLLTANSYSNYINNDHQILLALNQKGENLKIYVYL